MENSQSLILVVEDNKDILFHLKMVLEDHGFQVKTAINGKDAIRLLYGLKFPPDVILSDIMMPEMDGYEFFKEVSSHLLWNRIPFIFLTAKTTNEEIRFGKMLGVDDYLTKPFSTEDLLAVIRGKMEKNRKMNLMDLKVKELLSNLDIYQKSLSPQEKDEIILFTVKWDDRIGPKVDQIFTIKDEFPFSINKIGSQLFLAANFIYGHKNIEKAEGILLNIENIKRQGYIYFDAFPDDDSRSGEHQFALVLIAPIINYFQSLNIREIFQGISELIKSNKSWDGKYYWELISEILTSTIL